MRPSPKRVRELVSMCLQLAPRHFLRPLPSIHDEADQRSDFLYGIVLGLKAMRRKRKWEIGDPVKFLVRNGIWTLRRKRYKLMGRRLQILCKCGKQLKMSQRPCHGRMDERVIRARSVPVDPVMLESIEEIRIQKGSRFAVVDTG